VRRPIFRPQSPKEEEVIQLTRIRKEVQQADETIARIQNKPKESELIEIQRNMEPEKEEPEPDRHYCHTLDGGGSFVYTGQGMGLFPHENTLTRFSEKRDRK
jgi:hypothetical protein